MCVVYICICIPYHLNFSFISFHSLYIRANFQNVVRFSPYLSNKICNKISFHIGSSSFFRNKILYASLKHVLQRNNSKAKYIFLEYKNLCITYNMCNIKNKSQPIFLFFLDKFCPNGLEGERGRIFSR